MVTASYRVMVGQRDIAVGVPLTEAPTGPGHEQEEEVVAWHAR